MAKRFGIAWFLWRGLLALGIALLLSCLPAWGFAVWEQRTGGVYANPDAPDVWAESAMPLKMGDPISPFLHLFVKAPMARHDYSKLGTSLVEFDSGSLIAIENRGWSFGWPLRCLRFSEEGPASFLRGTYTPVKISSTWIGGWKVEPVAGWSVILPVRPLWWGLVWNMTIWMFAVGGLLLGVPLVRGVLRGRRGACGICGYDMRSHPSGSVCPECGPARGREARA